MKRGFNVLLILFVGMVILSCNNTKSYTDMLKAEGKAINRLIDQEGLDILKRMPSDNKFDFHEYVKLDNDVYLQIVDTGNGTRATEYSSHILCRFTANRFMLDTTTYQNRYSNFGPNSNGTSPIEFIYGYTTVIQQSSTTDYQSVLEGFMSEGIQIGLQYVGDRGRVRLIVPFKRGSSYDQQQGYPVHFEELEYKILE